MRSRHPKRRTAASSSKESRGQDDSEDPIEDEDDLQKEYVGLHQRRCQGARGVLTTVLLPRDDDWKSHPGQISGSPTKRVMVQYRQKPLVTENPASISSWKEKPKVQSARPIPQVSTRNVSLPPGNSHVSLAERLQLLIDGEPNSGTPPSKRVEACKSINRPAAPSLDKNEDESHDMLMERTLSFAVKRRSATQEDIIESCSSEDDLRQKTSLKKEGTSQSAVSPGATIWERFQEALLSAPPETNISCRARPNMRQTLSGSSARLQKVLQTIKGQQMQFGKALQLGQSVHGSSECINVLIVGKQLEAQLTTCQCRVLQSPEEWDYHSRAATAGMEDVSSPIIEVIFSSKISPRLELEIGQQVRVHPPWKKMQGVGKFGIIIICTYFSEMIP